MSTDHGHGNGDYPETIEEGQELMGRDHGYGRWPLLIMSGDDVTPEQAAEILTATTIWDITLNFSGSELAWASEVALALKVHRESETSMFADRNTLAALFRRIGFPQVEYLHNDRILPAGAEEGNGWLSLDGALGTSGTYLASSWPEPDGVQEEWVNLARRFPYLNLRAQLLSIGWEGISPVEHLVYDGWEISGGEVTSVGSADLVCPFHVPTPEESVARIHAGRQRKATDPDIIRAAVARLEASA